MLVFAAAPAAASPAFGIAMHGAPALKPGFTHLPYANPDAPKGGRVIYGEVGGFDSLNPYILRGRAPWGVKAYTVESLMARSWDEPFTLYGLLAESVETPPDRSWVEFTLRPQARFSDGSPVRVQDVIWSLQTLGTKGHPAYRNSWNAVESIKQTGPRSLRISFSTPNRELPLIMGLRPILERAQWQGRDFTKPGLEPVIGSGPYVVDKFEPGRFITFKRNPDYWGRDLAVNRGLYDFDKITYEYFRNSEALWSAVKAGDVSVFYDSDPVRWAEGYDFPLPRPVQAHRKLLRQLAARLLRTGRGARARAARAVRRFAARGDTGAWLAPARIGRLRPRPGQPAQGGASARPGRLGGRWQPPPQRPRRAVPLRDPGQFHRR
jgi:peptide/nickel transport system substrate-binding protein